MQLVLLAGELGEKYGKQHEYYNLQTPADAIKLLCINYPVLKQELMRAHHNGVGYKVIQGGAAMGYDELHLPFGSKPLLVVPVISGAGGGARHDTAGVGLVAFHCHCRRWNWIVGLVPVCSRALPLEGRITALAQSAQD